MILLYILAFSIPLILALFMTPWVIKFAVKIGATDTPDIRKVHTSVMPRIGGLAVILSAIGAIGFLYVVYPGILPSFFGEDYTPIIVACCVLSLFVLGFVDDLKPLSAAIKFGVQFLIAAVIFSAGFKISNVTNPLGEGMIAIGIFDFPITILWIVGIINAFNLIDGLDGLASGVAVIASVSIFVITSLSGQFQASIFALIIAGALVGFLRYNFNPAKIFLGDSGSLVIGFVLAILSIQTTSKLTSGFAVLLPLLVLALPITDTLVSMTRRLIGSFLNKGTQKPNQSPINRLHGMFVPDKMHIHHRLLSLGLSHRNAVLVLYFVSAFFAISAFIFTQIETWQRMLSVTIVLALALTFFVKKLKYNEIAIFNNGLMVSFSKKWIPKNTGWVVFTDAMFIMAAYSLTYYLISQINPGLVSQFQFSRTFAIVLTVQLSILWATGLYREKMNQFGLANALHTSATIFSAVGMTGLVLLATEALTLAEIAQFLIFNIYFLLTFLFGYRLTFLSLNHWFNREKRTGMKVLVYGAGEQGTLALQNILNSTQSDVKVVGFLDDDPNLHGKIIQGYPVLGGHWMLPKVHNTQPIDSIYLCDDDIRCENLKRLRRTALQKGITIKKLSITLLEIENSDVSEELADVESKHIVNFL